MAAVTIRNLPDDTHRALKLRAGRHGRSTEAEIRAILEEAVRAQPGPPGLGSALAAIGRRFGIEDGELDTGRDHAPIEPAPFE